MKAFTVYRDSVCYVNVNDNPAGIGHLKVYPAGGQLTLEQVPADDVAHMYKVASVCASLLFEGLKAQGTNIICHNGLDRKNPFCIEVIARAEKDGMQMYWEPGESNPADLQSFAKKIKDKLIIGEAPPQKPINLDKKPDKIVAAPKDQRIEHLRRTA